MIEGKGAFTAPSEVTDRCGFKRLPFAFESVKPCLCVGARKGLIDGIGIVLNLEKA